MSNLYTASRLKVLRECPLKHHYKYVLKIRTPETEVMRFGTVGHKALEVYYLAWQMGAGREARLLAALGAIDQAKLSHVDTIKLHVLVSAYDAKWGDQPWEILAVEQQFEYELGGFRVGGKIDAIVRNTETDQTFIVEHKTTAQDASPGSGYWERLTLDEQISIYVDGATMLGYEIAGCIYDVIQRPKHEPKSATPEAERKYTLGKGCAKCGGSGGGKAGIVQGRGHYIVKFPGEDDKQIDCEGCAGTGWKLNKDGEPEAPHIYAHQRENDETPEEFEERLVAVIASEIDEWLIRGEIVRLDDELPRMRSRLLKWIKVERASSLMFDDDPPGNTDACRSFGSLCPFFDACSHRASIDDTNQFPRSSVAHPELAVAA